MTRLVLRFCGAVAALLLAVGAAGAAYPEKPIRVIVPWGAGGTSDLSMRKIGEIAARDLGQPVVIENKPGATGVVGMAEMAKAAPDGYTLALATGATVFIAPSLRPVPFDPLKDLTPIINYSGSFHGVVVPADAPWKSLAELLADARAKPGVLTYATSGTYDGAHFAMLVIGRTQDLKLVNVPFQGGATALTAVLGRHVSFGVLSGFSEQVRAGRLRLLALLDGDRMPEFPSVPTLREAGIDWEYPSIMGVVGPAGLAPAVRARLEKSFAEAAATEEFQAYMRTIQMPMRVVPGKAFEEMLGRELLRYRKAAADYGIRQ
ncbi:MAG: tripartite tricarboxylate transporter substrate binding protein [Alphaproteobacteria bacterium]|nr:tripartite tricarboxylate transporter substrate binding protein [Alphaproteobacteria bacterium]